MTNPIYSPMKASWHLDRMAALRAGERPVPIRIQMVLSDLCNHDCSFCTYRADTGLTSDHFVEIRDDGSRNRNPRRFIETGKAKSILQDAADMGVKSILFTGGGEPTVHPQHLEIFKHALDLGLDCSMNTNGALLRPGWEEILPRFGYIRVSVDAGNAEDYSRIRGVGLKAYARTLDNLRQLANACEPTGCKIGAGYVLTPDNYEGLLDGIRDIRQTGSAYVRIAFMQSTEIYQPYEGVLDKISSLRVEMVKLRREGFDVIDLFDQVLGTEPAAALCGSQWLDPYIGANLKIYRCCYAAYTDLGEIGSLEAMTFREWGDSPEVQEMLRGFDARSCGTCPIEHKNRAIRYMADPKPPHVHFI